MKTPLWQEIVGYTCFGLLMAIVAVVVLACIAAGKYRR